MICNKGGQDNSHGSFDKNSTDHSETFPRCVDLLQSFYHQSKLTEIVNSANILKLDLKDKTQLFETRNS